MLSNSVTVNAETVEEAIEKGLKQLNVNKEQVETRIINEGKKGFLGFGKQEAIVEVSVKDSRSFTEIAKELDENLKVNNSKELALKEKNTETEAVNEFPESLEQLSEMEKISNDKDKEEKKQIDNAPESSDNEEYEEGQQYDKLDAISQQVADYLVDVISEYGAESTIEIERNGNQIIYNIDTDKSGLIIGKHGKIINSLQILAQSLLHHHYKHRASIMLNVGDYRDRRANVLEQIAQRTAEEVLKTKQPAILDSLPSYERKQIHAHLSNIEHIRTHSEGKDPNRYLVVEYINE